ncbi:MAG: hypothetical protein FF85_02900 [alpha proteobacterium QL1]|nr:MAG: hypothetical protein FF85_02900 [alpha proteobacterium QL1]
MLFLLFLILFNVNLCLPAILFVFTIPTSIIIINNNLILFSEIDAREIVIDEYIGQSIPIISAYYFLFFMILI